MLRTTFGTMEICLPAEALGRQSYEASAARAQAVSNGTGRVFQHSQPKADIPLENNNPNLCVCVRKGLSK